MANVPTHIIHNCETGEVTEVPLTAEEIAANEVAYQEAQQRKLEQETAEKALAEVKANAIAKLAVLGLTEEEAKAITGA